MLWRQETNGYYRCKYNSTSDTYSHTIHNPIVIPSSLLSGKLSHKIAKKWQRKLVNRAATKLQKKKRAIFDDKVSKVDEQAPKIRVGTATGQPQVSAASYELPIEGIPTGMFGHIMPSFRHNLLGIGILCDKDCKFLFIKRRVIIYDKDNKTFLTGWR